MAKNFSNDFIVEMRELLGYDEAQQLLDALNTDAVVSVRNNAMKKCEMAEWLTNAKKVEWSRTGIYLEERPQFTFNPHLHSGCFYVQDASSMIYEEIIARLTAETPHPLKYLDMCAAPGGKTTAAISALPPKSLVVANEFVAGRANILKENLQKWGSPDVIVTNSSADKLGGLSGLFDIVAVDAPCSGEGMMRKDDEAVRQWSPELIARCATLQWEIVSNVWNALRENGYLIYSTCTFNRTENELMVKQICQELGGETIDMHFPDEWGIIPGKDTSHTCYRFMPHKTKGEGLFVAIIRKTSEQDTLRIKQRKSEPSTIKTSAIEWLNDSKEYVCVQAGEKICAIRTEYLPMLTAINSVKAKIIQTGIELAIEKHKDLLPQHALSQSWARRESAFPTAELDYSTAIAFLSRENIVLPAECPRGYVIVTYKGSALGFVKNLGNRSNNLYPQEWRIRTTLR